MVLSTPVDPGPKGRQQGLKFNLTHVRNSHSLRGGLDFRQHYRTLDSERRIHVRQLRLRQQLRQEG